MEEGWGSFKIYIGKPIGQKRLGRPQRRWEDTIRMDPKEVGVNTRNWIDLAQVRDYWRVHVNAVLKLVVP